MNGLGLEMVSWSRYGNVSQCVAVGWARGHPLIGRRGPWGCRLPDRLPVRLRPLAEVVLHALAHRWEDRAGTAQAAGRATAGCALPCWGCAWRGPERRRSHRCVTWWPAGRTRCGALGCRWPRMDATDGTHNLCTMFAQCRQLDRCCC